MSKVRFMWDNEIDTATITSTTQHPNFPDDNVVHRWHTRPWRSRYGTGSGWGYFAIWLNTNDKVDFNEGGGERIATLTPGVYTADSLATHIGTVLTARSAAVGLTWTYVCSYDDATNKFTIAETSGPNNFSLLWSTGTNGSGGTGQTVGDTIGFSEAADDAGSASYLADEIRIHTVESIYFDFGVQERIQAIAIKNNNFQSDATIIVYGGNTYPPVDISYTFGTIDNDVMVYFWTSTQAYRYWRIEIADWDNPDGYIEMGRIFLGGYFSPTRGFKEEYGDNILDPSDVMFSKGGQISSNEEDEYISVDLSFPAATADYATFKSMFNDRGRRKDLFVCLDTDNYATETYYMRFASQFNASHMWNREYYWVQTQLEELR